MKFKPFSSTLLALAGIIMMGLGVYFVVWRPPLLPEDPRYMGTTLADIQTVLPGLLTWLRRVFWVMGGYIFSTGLLTLYLARTSFRDRDRGAVGVAGLAGLTSIGWMVVVNFIIASDFKWVLLALTLPYASAILLFFIEGAVPNKDPAQP